MTRLRAIGIADIDLELGCRFRNELPDCVKRNAFHVCVATTCAPVPRPSEDLPPIFEIELARQLD